MHVPEVALNAYEKHFQKITGRMSHKLAVPLHAIVSSLFLTVLMGINSTFTIMRTRDMMADSYLKTARFDFGQVMSPWAFRLTKPILAGILPGDETAGFTVLTYLFLIMFLIGTYLLLRDFGIDVPGAYIGMAIAAFSFPFRTNLNFPWYIDDLTHCLIIFGILAIIRRQFVIFSAILFFGALNHEHIFTLVPIFLFYVLDEYGPKKSLRLLICLVPGFSAFILARFLVPSIDQGYAQFYFSRENIMRCYHLQGGFLNILKRTHDTFGFLWYSALFGLIHLKLTSVERSLYLLFPLSAAQLIIGLDTSRLLAINLPILIILSIRCFRRLHWSWSAFLLFAFVFRSLVRFAPFSTWHPWWLLQTPLAVLRLIDLTAFLILILTHPRRTRLDTSKNEIR